MTGTFKLLAIGLMLLPFSVSSAYAAGTVGPAGPKGDKGATGATGLKGDKGTAGAAGPKGATGAAGPKGATGAAGLKGATGATGATGLKGDKGATGAAGKNGTSSAGLVYILGDIGPSGTGNIVFYVDGSGQHGLEAKTTDAKGGVSMDWATAMSTAQAYGTCLTPVLRTPTCWHLPTKSELALLSEQKNIVGGFANNNYWSSTEYNSNDAWYQYFASGYQYPSNMSLTYRVVRAVRAF